MGSGKKFSHNVMSGADFAWEHVCARAEDDGRPDRAILGKYFSRHDFIHRVCRVSSNMSATEEYFTNVWVPVSAREHH